ncbi:unnamed protein product [Blepharisma stoltei]|uniref:Uncharacterized protein n=1 Tax=Blepharisma stoltei TaxID=1481888 RepID=A0AAU9KPE0_9CILI|nr:unnamed protein product [Blepharisma stoltei]
MSQIIRGNTLILSESDQESHMNLSINYEAFDTFMEPNSADVKDTRRFTPNQSKVFSRVTPKSTRSFSPSFIVKHSSEKTSPAVRSRSRCHRKPSPPQMSEQDLNKKIEHLEKQQKMWKERALVWDKEKRFLLKQLENSFPQDPSGYYRHHLKQWQVSQDSYLKRVSEYSGKSEDYNNESSVKIKLEEIKKLLLWISIQKDENSLKYIKIAVNEELEKLKTFTVDESLTKDPNLPTFEFEKSIEDFSTSKIEANTKTAWNDFNRKNAELNEYIGELESENKKIKEFLKDLQYKNENLSQDCNTKKKKIEELLNISSAMQKELKTNKKENQDLKNALISLETEIEAVSRDLREKESENLMLKSVKNDKHKVEKLSQGYNIKVKQIEAELESKSYEIRILATEKQRLQENLLQFQKINEDYVLCIQELKDKLKELRLKNIDSSLNKGKFEKESSISHISEEEIDDINVLDILPDESPEESRNEPQKNNYEIIIKDLEDQIVTQKLEYEKELQSLSGISTFEDFSAFTSCMCSALEEIFNSQIYQS